MDAAPTETVAASHCTPRTPSSKSEGACDTITKPIEAEQSVAVDTNDAVVTQEIKADGAEDAQRAKGVVVLPAPTPTEEPALTESDSSVDDSPWASTDEDDTEDDESVAESAEGTEELVLTESDTSADDSSGTSTDEDETGDDESEAESVESDESAAKDVDATIAQAIETTVVEDAASMEVPIASAPISVEDADLTERAVTTDAAPKTPSIDNEPTFVEPVAELVQVDRPGVTDAVDAVMATEIGANILEDAKPEENEAAHVSVPTLAEDTAPSEEFAVANNSPQVTSVEDEPASIEAVVESSEAEEPTAMDVVDFVLTRWIKTNVGEDIGPQQEEMVVDTAITSADNVGLVKPAAADSASPEAPAVYDEPTIVKVCLLYTSPSPRDKRQSRMPSSA